MKKVNVESINKISNCIRENFFIEEDAISVRKIANRINIPYQTVWYYIRKMIEARDVIESEKFGYILKQQADSYVSKRYRNIPVLGDVPCGEPDISEMLTDEYIKLSSNIINSDDYFVLKAKGNSMVNIDIENGDYVLVKRQDYAYEGEVVVILSTEFNDSGVTLKRYFPEADKGRIRLHPENDLMKDFYIKTGNIQGIAKKVIKIKDIL